MGYTELKIRFFGGLEVERAGEPIRGFRSQKIASLLAYLAYHRDRPHPREVLLEAFWPEVDVDKARMSLRQAVYQLRRLLGKDAILAQDRAVQLNPELDCRCDAREFERLLREAELASGAEQARLRERAVGLYRGRFLDGFYEDWVLSEAERLREAYREALEGLLRHHRALGNYAQALEYGRMALAQDPLHEELHRDLMELYGVLGRRSAALRQYEACRRILHEELGVEPGSEIRVLREHILRGEAVSLERKTPHNLPHPRTSFVGRAREIRGLGQALEDHRLVTLVGLGGVGKTRLAREAAFELRDRFRDGVWWVELASVSDPDRVPHAVATALEVREGPGRSPVEALIRTLRSQCVLLVLDNCEHLLDASANLVIRLLEGCPSLSVLATSRERLGLLGEAVWEVSPLGLPPPDAPVDDLMGYDTIKLFVERACACRPDFALTDDNAEDVRRICRRLEGLPLALELAAARVPSLSVRQIAARLEDRFRWLTSGSRAALPRHRTLWAAMDWSYELLSPDERRLLHRLSVFAGRVSLEAVEAVCGEDEEGVAAVVERLSSLVDKSLVRFKARRYRLLEIVRQYAREKLEDSDEAEAIRNRHFDYFLRRAERGERGLLGSEEKSWLVRLGREAEEFRTALRWAFQEDRVEEALRLVCALERFWYVTGQVAEGRRWTEEALRRERAGFPPALRGRVRLGAARFLLLQGKGNLPAVQRLLEEAVGLLRESGEGEEGTLAYALLRTSQVLADRGFRERAESLQREAIALYRRRGDLRGLAVALNYRGNQALQVGATPAARQAYEEALALNRRLGRRHEQTVNLTNLGELAEVQEDWDRAAQCYQEVLSIRRELGDRRGLGVTLARIAGIVARSEPRRAARLLGAAYETLEACGAGPDTVMFHERTVASLKAALGDAGFEEEVQEGRVLGLSAAVALAERGERSAG